MFFKICKLLLLVLMMANVPSSASPQAVKAAKRAVSKAAAKYGAKSASRRAASHAAAESFANLARERALRNAPEVAKVAVKKGVRGEGGRVVRNEARNVFARAAMSRAERVGQRRLASSAARDIADIKEPMSVLRQKKFQFSSRKPVAPAATKSLPKQISPGRSLADREVSSVCRKFDSFKEGEFKKVNLSDGSVKVSYPGHSTGADFSADGKKIAASGGSRVDRSFSQNEFLNNPLPNKTYVVDKHATYKTDSKGRTVSVSCDESALYNSVGPGNRSSRPSFKKLLNNDYGVSNSKYDGGHLISNANNGIHEKLNVIAMESRWQRHGSWAKFERERQKAVKEGKKVFTQMKISYYDDAPAIPRKIVVDSWIDGKKITKVFEHPHP